MKKLLISCVLVLSIMMNGNLMLKTNASTPTPIFITEADDGKEITLQKGDLFEIHLQTRLSTGYAWHLDGILNEENISLITEGSCNEGSGSGMVGGLDTQSWTYEATKEGWTGLRFSKTRFDGLVESTCTIKLKIVSDDSQTDAIEITEKDNNKIINIEKGQLVNVNLLTEGSGAYTWRVKYYSSKYFNFNSYNKIPGLFPGAPTTQSWTYESIKTGNTAIKFEQVYLNGSVTKTFYCIIKVK